MSAVVTPRAAPSAVPTEAPRDGWAAVFALARFETRKLLTRLPTLVAFTVYVAWIVWHATRSWDDHPALQNVDRVTQSVPPLVGLAVLLCANSAGLRSRRHGTEPHFAVLPLQPWRRTAAHALSVVPAALLTAVCVAGQFTWEALKPGAVGHGSPAELAVGPLTVLLFGATGVLLARLVRSAFAAPLLTVCFLFLFVLGTGTSGDDATGWLTPSVPQLGPTLPSGLLDRPAAWHALYLLGAALTAAVLAVLVAGARHWTVRAGLALTLALALTGAVAQAAGVSPSPETTAARERASVTPEKEQTCVERGRSRYCAFPEWTAWTGSWAGVVDRVQSLAGGTASTQGLVVRQRVEARYGLESDSALAPSATAHQVTVGTEWGGNRVPEFATAVAAVLVAGSEKAASDMCDGRMVTVMWLSVGWQDDPLDVLRRVRLDDSLKGAAVVLAPTDPLLMTSDVTTVVRNLLAKPRAEVTAKVKEHWAELTAPGVTSARAARLLGVTAPKAADTCGE
ncbi:ABC transporter [Streptomyces fumigatiscleroticus]|nr:ABC transporter [Streptomyces fumigatiscleroticus]